MNYWDSSAVVTLLLKQEQTSRTRELFDSESEIITWWGTKLECASALARYHREKLISDKDSNHLSKILLSFAESWREVIPCEAVRETACRLIRVHPLRAADSLQLASAITIAKGKPSNILFICFDKRLNQAASKEGFDIL